MNDLKELHNKRGVLKRLLTLFEQHLNKLSETVSEKEVANLKTRLSKILPMYDEFYDIQNEIEYLTADMTIEFEEREKFQDEYFELVSRANIMIKNGSKDDTQSHLGSENSVATNTSQMQPKLVNVTLPTINLPTFEGTFSHWREFADAFTSLIHLNPDIPNGTKLNYLKSSLKGDPADLLRPLEITDENYLVAWEKLNKKYNNKRRIIYNHVRNLLEIQPVIKESVQALQKFVHTIETHMECLKTWEQPVQSWDAILVPLFLAKLDVYTNKEWESRVNKGESTRESIPSLNVFLEFLNNKVSTLEAISTKRSDNIKPVVNYNKNQTSRSFATVDISCIICNGNHIINHCEVFTKLNSQERNCKVKELKLCINCLRKGHFIQNCQSRNKCRICSKKHHTLLHYSDPKSSQPEENKQKEETKNSETTATYASSVINNKHVLLSTARVNVIDEKQRLHDIRVLLDSASQSNFITEDTCDRLQLRKEKININCSGISQANLAIKYQTQVRFQSKHNNFGANITCLVIPKIVDKLPTFTVNVKDFHVPPNIKLSDPDYHQPGPIDMLIGANLFWDLLCVGQVKHPNNPIIQKTKLGWIVAGSINESQTTKKQEIKRTFFTVDNLQKEVERFWKMDEFLQKEPRYTPEEQVCLDLFEETTRREEGRFVVRMPLKPNIEELGNSLAVAKSRFYKLENRFNGNKEFKEMYSKVMEDYFKQNHINKSQEDEVHSFYLPHHAVLKESSQTTKLRIVFDGSCQLEDGLSINKLQYVGPTLQDELFNIITRFRTHEFVLTGDITQMYRQILIHPSDRKYQKILWRKQSDEPLEVFELNRVTFGMTSAPFLAIRCLMQVAKENEIEYPIESQIIKDDFYVDDLITGCNDINQLKTIKINLQKILQSGGFSLCKFNSNIAELRDENVSCSNTLNISDETFKTLGVQWNPSTDTFSYVNDEVCKATTVSKRTILGQVAKLFDPLGLLAPIVIIAKILLQELWQAKLDWDESIPLDLHTRWLHFEDNLKWIKTIKVKRKAIIENAESIELHIFADASERAYGTCIYLRSTNQNHTEIHLLAAKSRVAPLNITTIPRLELCAAVIAAQLASKFKSILKVKIDKEYFWTDSQIVLAWIKSEPSKYKTYIANRIAEIQELTKPNDWFYVRSHCNPADLISRGVSAHILTDLNLWWQGPPWLKEDSSSWEIQPQHIITDLPEQRTVLRSYIISEDTSWFPIEKFSSFNKAKRVMAYCLRYINNSKNPKATRKSGELTVDEISKACIQLVKIAQKQEFAAEINSLINNKPLHRRSKLLNLAPFIDPCGIVRVGGRLKLSAYPYDKKHPILLPKSHHLTCIIFRQEHINTMHSGPTQLLAVMREKYWPIAGKNTAKRIIRQCLKCIRLKGEVNQQLMGQLPIQRTVIMPPFHSVGIDYAGPFMLKDREGRGSKTYKAYICLFICFSTKAIHLELVTQLTTKAFIATLKRFIARRGKPLHIFSDNGTNFVGAINELASIQNFLTNEYKDIQSQLSLDNINWHLIPPHSPNFGGLWEAGVKSTKKHLKRVLNNTLLTYESFSTILTQIESILNSRPLTPLTTDPSDYTALTPGHFLIGRPLTALPDPDVTDIKTSRLDKFQQLQLTVKHFWDQWQKEYVNNLQTRAKWSQQGKPIKINDMVIVKEDHIPPAQWKLGRILQVHPGQDGVIRVVTIKCQKGEIKRPVNKICILPINE